MFCALSSYLSKKELIFKLPYPVLPIKDNMNKESIIELNQNNTQNWAHYFIINPPHIEEDKNQI